MNAPWRKSLARLCRFTTLIFLIALSIGQSSSVVWSEDASTFTTLTGGEMIATTQSSPCVASTYSLFLPLITSQSSAASNPARPATATAVAPRSPARSSKSVSNDFAAATAFLYTGNNPIQKDMVPRAIDPLRAAVLRGQVCDRSGNTLANAQITILDHSEYGSTLTNADGTFDISVNGGGTLIVVYTKSGYLPAQRQVQVPWQDYAWLPNIAMIPLDAQVTTIATNASTMQVARGSPVADADGTRRATLLVPPGTQAQLVMHNGTRQPVTSLNVRATEYTVGQAGPATMPAELPPTSGYTYAVEYSTDEGIAAGAADIQFNQPLFHYVENFLNFPIGMAVPVGYYDKQKATWVPSANGRVVKILSIASGLANLDTDGDGVVDNGAALGVTNDERQNLATLYQSGTSLWRVPITHFTPWDCNWPYGPPSGASGPNQSPPRGDPPCDCPNGQSGSIISSQPQVLGERVDIAGTPFSLHYSSDRVPGRKTAYTLDIPLSGASVPTGLKRIDLEVFVAGQRIAQQFSAAPNQHTVFTWDGMDGYGRTVLGHQRVVTRIGYVYGAVYQQPAQFDQAFAVLSGVPLTSNRARQEVTLWQEWQGTLGTFDERSVGLGGWSLRAHHVYDPKGKVLYLGDGTRRSTESLGAGIISTYAGAGAGGSWTGDGGPATQAHLRYPNSVTVGPDGSLYIADSVDERVRRVTPDGIITTVAGTGTWGYSGDGGLATSAMLNNPQGIAVGSDGTLYIADRSNERIRRVGTDGIITTVAGIGVYGYSGDGGVATLAKLNEPYGVAVAPDGALYIADSANQRIRRVGTDGIITTFAGNGLYGFSGDGGPATQARFANPWRVAVGPDGSLFVADRSNFRVRRIGTNGIITTVAGNGTGGFSGDGGAATSAQLSALEDIAVSSDGSLFIADRTNYRVRWVGTDGIINTAVGNGTYGFSGDGGLALRAQLDEPIGIATAPDGSLYIADWFNQRVRKVAPVLPGGSAGDILLPAEDASEVYIFNGAGRHLRTLHALTGAVLYQFSYDSAFRLTAVMDASGNITTIERDASGNPTAILGPYGQRSSLAQSASGFLTSIIDPGNRTTQLTSTSDGLLTGMTDPRGNTFHFTYDALGRLTRDDDPANGFKTLARTEANQSYQVTLSTALNRTTSYQVTDQATGSQTRVNTLPSGLQERETRGADNLTTTHSPDGMDRTQIPGPDPRWGMFTTLANTEAITTPLGLRASIATTRTATLTDTNNIFSLGSLVETQATNGRSFISSYDGTSKTWTRTSPEGRVTSTTLNTQGRPVSDQVSGLYPTNYGYDSHGRLSTITQGTGGNARTFTFTYNSSGYLATITDPLGRTANMAYDAAGRVTSQTLPGGRVITFGYDANDNVTAITPPGKTAHAFGFTPVNLRSAYTPPSLGSGTTATAYAYNLDRQLTGITRPDGQVVTMGFDSAGRRNALTTLRGTISYVYSPATGNLATINAPGGINLSLSYDGALLTGQTWVGPVAGSMSRTFDNSFRTTSISVNGAQPIAFQYDKDDLLTTAGAMTLTRNAQHGLIVGSQVGNVSDTITYNGFAEPITYNAAYNSTSLYSVQRTRDNLGRITVVTETISGVTDVYNYTYDLAGRLTQVNKNGASIAGYTYDSNGNRLSFTDPGGTINGSYDSQDRLTSYGSATYAYTANGELQSKTASGQTTTYQYDALGNLTAVTLPGGTQIGYLVDGKNRRVGKRVNSALVQGLLYQDDLRPIAELDGSNNVVSRFVYASRDNVPDYMLKGGVTYRIISDHLGSPRLVVNTATGAVVQRIDYAAFGNVATDTNPGFQPFGFAGGLYDRDTKLVRFGARDYDAETGRWTAKDPILFDGGQTNLFEYVRNDPVNWHDSNGRCEGECPGGAGGGGGDDKSKGENEGDESTGRWYKVKVTFKFLWEAASHAIPGWEFASGAECAAEGTRNVLDYRKTLNDRMRNVDEGSQ